MNTNSGVSRDPKRILTMFSAIAPRYDLGNHLLSFGMDLLWRRRAARAGLGPQTRRILDCCCGTGDLALAFARRIGAGRDPLIVGCDFAQPMLAIARDKIRRLGAPIALAAADTVALPFPDGAFDLVAAAFGLRNLADREAGLREMARVLRPGGAALILEFTTPRNSLFRAIYHFYFRRLLPLAARAATGSNEYGYLPASVAEFPSPGALCVLMERCGLRDARYELLTGGIAAIHTAARPAGKEFAGPEGHAIHKV